MILVTGGTGFLGRHLLPGLCREGYRVRVLTRTPDAYPWLARYPNLEVIRGDLRNPEAADKAVAGCEFVIHAAGLFRFWGKEQDFIETNVNGTRHILDASIRAGVRRFIYISTVAILGEPDPDTISDENAEPHPADPYQRSKLIAEQSVLDAYHEANLPAIVLRPGAFYGPLGEYAFNRLFFKDPMRGIIMQVDGGRYIIFPAYITDVVKGIMKTLEKGRSGEIYNLSGDWITHHEAFDIICEEANLHWPRLPIPGWLGILTARVLEAIAVVTQREPFWPMNLHSYVYNYWRVSSDKARQELDFDATPFREGARRTIAWYRAGQPDDIPEVNC